MHFMCSANIHTHGIHIYMSILKYRNNLMEWKLKRKLEIQLSLPRLPNISCVYFSVYAHTHTCTYATVNVSVPRKESSLSLLLCPLQHSNNNYKLLHYSMYSMRSQCFRWLHCWQQQQQHSYIPMYIYIYMY